MIMELNFLNFLSTQIWVHYFFHFPKKTTALRPHEAQVPVNKKHDSWKIMALKIVQAKDGEISVQGTLIDKEVVQSTKQKSCMNC